MLHDISLNDIIRPHHDITIRSARTLTKATTSGNFSGSKSSGIIETLEISFSTSSDLSKPIWTAVATVKRDCVMFFLA